MRSLMFDYNLLLTSLINLLHTNIFFKICIIIPIGLVTYLLHYKIELKDRGLYKYKIHNASNNLILIGIYLSFNIYFLLYIRTKYLNKDIVLTEALINIRNFCTGVTIQDTILILLLLILLVYLVLKSHHYFRNELIKRNLALFYNGKQHKMYKVDARYLLNIHGLIGKIIMIAATLSVKYNIGDPRFQQFSKYLRYCFLRLPGHLIASFFLYEILCNNLTLSSTFNHSLYFFVIYTFYKRISTYHLQSEDFINQMVYNMYYRTSSVLYINLPKSWEDIIYQYVNNGLQRDREKHPVPSLDYNLGEFEFTIDALHTFRSNDGIKYTNNQGDYIIEEKIQD